MSLECVIDGELFQKYCSEAKCSYIREVAKSKVDRGEGIYIIRECNCIVELLEAIARSKCVLAYSKKIIDEYLTCFDKMPNDVAELLGHIISNKDKVKKVNPEENPEGFKLDDFQKIESTQLKHKKVYLDVAKCLNERTIVCTKDELISIYNPNSSILMACEIRAKCVCDQWDEVKK